MVAGVVIWCYEEGSGELYSFWGHTANRCVATFCFQKVDGLISLPTRCG